MTARPRLRSVASLPSPEVYEREFTYWPWRRLILRARDLVVDSAPQGATVVDYMCGTGYLLREIRKQRPDLRCFGCDIHLPYVEYATARDPDLKFVHADVRDVEMEVADYLICTAGLHHVPFEEQSGVLTKLAAGSAPDAYLLIGEEVTQDYASELERQTATLCLNVELISRGVADEWPPDVLEAAIEVLKNDLFLKGEFKRGASAWRELIGNTFEITDEVVTWEPSTGGGDILFLCRPRHS